jgi:transcriptional regulator GlxA family with amidase domain
MKLSIVAFDNFTDIDVFLMWDIFNRVDAPNWSVEILGSQDSHISSTGIRIPMHGQLERARHSDAVLFASGIGTRAVIKDQAYLDRLQLDPTKQLIGSMCSGSLILAKLGLIQGPATTYPTSRRELIAMGVEVVERPFVRNGNVATAAGCLAAQYLAGWIIETLTDEATKERALLQIQPVGEGQSYAADEAGVALTAV